MKLDDLKPYIKPALGLAFFVLALLACHHILLEVHPSAIREAMSHIPTSAVVWAFLATAFSFLMLVGYENSADKYAGGNLPLKTLAFGSFCSFAVSNAIGLTLFSGGTVRYRLYSRYGLGGMQIAKITLFSSGAFMLTLPLLAALLVLPNPVYTASLLHVSPKTLIAFALLPILSYASIYVYFLRRQKPEVTKYTWFSRFGRHRVELPKLMLSLRQFVITSLDIVASGTVLYCLLPQQPNYAVFLLVYIIAITVGVLSNVPGGLGIFESIMLAAFSTALDPASLAAALVLYRLIYYVIPLLIACVLLVGSELNRKKERVGKILRLSTGLLSSGLVPSVMALLVFLSGLLLIFSGSIPVFSERLKILGTFLPPGLVDTFHLAASVTGVFCLLLAKGLYKRLSGAWTLTVVLLLIGSAFSLLKGLNWVSASVLLGVALLLIPCRKSFYRKSRLNQLSFSPTYLLTVAGALVLAVWLLFFNYKNVEYSGDLWWQFGLDASVSRSLRAALACSVIILYIGVRWLLRMNYTVKYPDESDIVAALTVFQKADKPDAALALMGDKMLLFNEEKDAFIMYGKHGRSLIALYDPVGPAEKCPDLTWQFRDICDQNLCRPVFYQVSAENLSMYMDIGLVAYKIGEEAVVDLSKFTLESRRNKELRHEFSRGVREGLSLEILEAGTASMPRLKEISDQWLVSKNVREKGFSLGRFDENYLKHFRIATLRKNGEIVAFANLFEPGSEQQGRNRVSVDLMRYSNDAPKSTMTFLFVSLMQYYKEHGSKEFTMGMAPLSGVTPYKNAPLVQRFGVFLYRKGEHFYNFQGLRHFKEKFNPNWEPRYVAIPRADSLFLALADASILIAGGVKGIVGK